MDARNLQGVLLTSAMIDIRGIVNGWRTSRIRDVRHDKETTFEQTSCTRAIHLLPLSAHSRRYRLAIGTRGELGWLASMITLVPLSLIDASVTATETDAHMPESYVRHRCRCNMGVST